jgi:hypothetical protein
MAARKSHPIWNVIFLVLELVCVPLALWWIPSSHLPEPGWAVAFIAGAAAAMSVHDEMKGWQKCIWLLVIGAFLITELRAIHKDRLDSDAKALADRQAQEVAFKGVRDAQDSDFSATAGGLKTAIRGIQSTLKTADSTLLQTRPHAFIRQDIFVLDNAPTPPAPFVEGVDYSFALPYINDGNEIARVLQRDAEIYVAEPDDLGSQKSLAIQFEEAWRKLPKPKYSPAVQGKPAYWSKHRTFTKGEIDEIRQKGYTVYVLRRIEYSDSTGKWQTDSCDHYQVDSKGLWISVTHP